MLPILSGTASALDTIYGHGSIDDYLSSEYGPELLTNGGFEAGTPPNFTGWTITVGTGAIAADTAIFTEGTRSAKLTAGSTKNTVLISPTISVTPGKTYRLSFKTRGDGTYCGRVQMRDVTHATDIRALLDTQITGTAWQPVEYIYNIPAGCTQFAFYLYCPNTDTGIVWFDEVSVKQKSLNGDYITRTNKSAGAVAYSEIIRMMPSPSKGLLEITPTGVIIARGSSGKLFKSLDNASSFIQISYNPGISDPFPYWINAAKVTQDGYLIVITQTGQKVYRSNSPAWNDGFSEVLTLEGVNTRVEPYYGSFVYGNMVLIGEYNGTDTTPRAYMSLDSGATWTKILTIAAATHIHHISYDPYRGIIFIVTGDGATYQNIYFSMDMGRTWNQHRPPGKCSSQYIQIIPLPEGILFLTDASPAGGYFLASRVGMPGIFENLSQTWNLGTFTPVPLGCQPAIVYGSEGCAYFSMMYQDSSQSAVRPLVATRDGVNFFTLCTPSDIPAGVGTGLYGIRNIFIVGNYLMGEYSKGAAGDYLFKIPLPVWM